MASDASQSGENSDTTAPPKKRRRRGRDRLNRNWAPADDKQLISFMRTCPLLMDTAHYFEVSQDTIEDYIRRRWGVSYTEFRAKHLADTRAVLVNTALELALVKKDWRAIQKCLEYYCKWHQVLDINPGAGDNVIKLQYSLDPQPNTPQLPVTIDVTPKE
jgi:hypothetical protein